MAKNFTAEAMIEAVEWEVDSKGRHALFDAFRKMRFHGFLDPDTFEDFCAMWREKELYK